MLRQLTREDKQILRYLRENKVAIDPTDNALQSAVIEDLEMLCTDPYAINHRLLQKRKVSIYTNMLESFLYLLSFVPYTGFLWITLGFIINNTKTLYANTATEGTDAERNKTSSLLKNTFINIVPIISFIAVAFNPLIIWVCIGLTALSAFYNIYQKFSIYYHTSQRPYDVNHSISHSNYSNNLHYAKSDAYIALRSETVKIIGVICLASLFVTSLTVLSSGIFPLVCVGIGVLFTAYNAYVKHKQIKDYATTKNYIENLPRLNGETINRINEILPRLRRQTRPLYIQHLDIKITRSREEIKSRKEQLEIENKEILQKILLKNPLLKEDILENLSPRIVFLIAEIKANEAKILDAKNEISGTQPTIIERLIGLREQNRIKATAKEWKAEKPVTFEKKTDTTTSASTQQVFNVSKIKQLTLQELLNNKAHLQAIIAVQEVYESESKAAFLAKQTLQKYKALIKDNEQNPLLKQIQNNLTDLEKIVCSINLDNTIELLDNDLMLFIDNKPISYMCFLNIFCNPTSAINILNLHDLRINEKGEILSNTGAKVSITFSHPLIDETSKLISKYEKSIKTHPNQSKASSVGSFYQINPADTAPLTQDEVREKRIQHFEKKPG